MHQHFKGAWFCSLETIIGEKLSTIFGIAFLRAAAASSFLYWKLPYSFSSSVCGLNIRWIGGYFRKFYFLSYCHGLLLNPLFTFSNHYEEKLFDTVWMSMKGKNIYKNVHLNFQLEIWFIVCEKSKKWNLSTWKGDSFTNLMQSILKVIRPCTVK